MCVLFAVVTFYFILFILQFSSFQRDIYKSKQGFLPQCSSGGLIMDTLNCANFTGIYVARIQIQCAGAD